MRKLTINVEFKKGVGTIIRLAIIGLLFAIVMGLSACSQAPQTSASASPSASATTSEAVSDTVVAPQLLPEPPPTVLPVTQHAPTEETLYPVIRVVDGDTIHILKDGRDETLRLIGIDTPETKDPRKTVQCFGREASAKAEELLSGKRVRIEQDPTQDTWDKYARLLVYVWLQDGTFFNLVMVRDGYAHEYTYERPYQYQADFKAAQQQASAEGLGLWSPQTCNGDTVQPADKQGATESGGLT
ncbi:MAG: hypothetical protein EXR50_00885, partial [Dehalococcoidia bacterium]|nr:hypothetical protein [Dehalococcoidia bacterium]